LPDVGARRRGVQEPEPETIGRAQAGDLRAFESLVRAYQTDVWRFAYHLTRNPTAAEDVAQDAFLRAYRAIGSYRGTSRFSSWLMRIVRNCAIDAYRKTRRETVTSERDRVTGGGLYSVVDPPDSAERVRINEAIRRLPMPLREPFVVIEVMGFTYEEASSILGTRIGTIKSRMHRARAALMEALEEKEVAGEM
jgi:RNA polymerase sigma-70 factor (ECF subfamily)